MLALAWKRHFPRSQSDPQAGELQGTTWVSLGPLGVVSLKIHNEKKSSNATRFNGKKRYPVYEDDLAHF